MPSATIRTLASRQRTRMVPIWRSTDSTRRPPRAAGACRPAGGMPAGPAAPSRTVSCIKLSPLTDRFAGGGSPGGGSGLCVGDGAGAFDEFHVGGRAFVPGLGGLVLGDVVLGDEQQPGVGLWWGDEPAGDFEQVQVQHR